MQAGATRYRLARVDPVALVIGAVVEEFRRTRRPAGATPMSPASLVSSRASSAIAEALGRAIWNLLENAARYSPDGRPIAVACRGRRPRPVAIRVSDQGAGIPREQPVIFEQFFRGASASASA